jgi:hypothetical protein
MATFRKKKTGEIRIVDNPSAKDVSILIAKGWQRLPDQKQAAPSKPSKKK